MKATAVLLLSVVNLGRFDLRSPSTIVIENVIGTMATTDRLRAIEDLDIILYIYNFVPLF